MVGLFLMFQFYTARMAELEEVKKADGRYTVETGCESLEETERSYIWVNGSEETIWFGAEIEGRIWTL